MSFSRKLKFSSTLFRRIALVLWIASGATAAHAQSAMLPPPDPLFAAPTSNYIWAGSAENDVFRKPDKYTDAPQVDADGVRHFANGRHIDLSKVSVEDAVAQTNASTLGVKQKPNTRRQSNFANNGNNVGNFAIDYRNSFQNNAYSAGYYGNRNQGYGANYANNFSPRRSRDYVTDWSGSEVAAINNQNYRQQTNYWNGRRQRRNPRWNWN